MNPIKMSLLAAMALTATAVSFHSFAEPGVNQPNPQGKMCTFHGEAPWGGVPAGSGPLACTNATNWASVSQAHEEETKVIIGNTIQTHNAPDCIVLVEPDM